MSLETFFEQFELLSDAPNGVQKLRELILQLAVRGQLVPQDPDDEPASALLGEIDLIKRRLIDEGELKRIEPSSPVEPNAIRYKLPGTWQWIRLGEVTQIIMGQSPPGTTYNTHGEGVPLINGPVEFGTQPFSKTVVNQFTTAPTKMCREGDLLICVRGATTGRTNIAGFNACIGRGVAAIRPFFDPEFIHWYVLSSRQTILSMGTGSTFPSVSYDKIRDFPCPLPPLAEQKRIVAKVDELMALCDRLEEQQNQRRSACIRINDGAVTQLLTASEPKEFDRHWQRVCDNFDLFYSLPDNITKLRQSILQLAVMGRLVPQEPGDEPAAGLLQQIRNHKTRLVEEKKVPKEKILYPIDPSNYPYLLPSFWQWVRLGDLAKMIEYGTSEKASEIVNDVPIFRMNNIQDGKVVFQNLKYVSRSIKDLPRLYLEDGDLLFNRTNSYELVGKTGVFRGETNQYTFASYLIRISLLRESVSSEFVNLAMNSAYFRQTQIEPEITQQCGQANFNGTKLKNALIPLPPLAEQKRIVEKVDRLMTLCDQLEAQLNQAQGDSARLMEVAVRQVLAA